LKGRWLNARIGKESKYVATFNFALFQSVVVVNTNTNVVKTFKSVVLETCYLFKQKNNCFNVSVDSILVVDTI